MDMAGSSNAPTQVLKFMTATNVNVSNFVSVKLSGRSNYKIWKAQMLCVIKSQVLLHIIDAEHPFPEDKGVHMIGQYDELVKGWIFGSMNEKVLNDLVDLGTAQEIWMKLESLFSSPVRDTEEGYSYNALDFIAPAVSSIREDLKYIQASSVNVSSFVTVKLSGRHNYEIWKAQMICLMESQELLHILGDHYPFPRDKGAHMIWLYDRLVKGWIFGSMEERVLNNFTHFNFARDVWRQLQLTFTSATIGDSLNAREELKYTQATHVNVSNFVSVKLSGRSNYKIWKAQMLGLIDSQDLLHFINNEIPFPGDANVHFLCGLYKRYDQLVQGWIFSSLNERLLKKFLNSESAIGLWMRLESTFYPPTSDGEDSLGFMFGIESVRDVPDTKRLLYKAAVEGCWWKAKSILKVETNAATEPVTANGNTILHLAVEMGHNYFVEKLLEYLKDGNGIEKQNKKGRTALYSAARVGNEYAAQLLVQKRKELLLIKDNNGESPLDSANISNKFNISTYMLKTAPPSTWKAANRAIQTAIIGKQYDLAGDLLVKFPSCASTRGTILKTITITFPPDLGFKESFIYPSLDNVFQKTSVRGSILFHYNILDKCIEDISQVMKIYNNSCCSQLGKISKILLVPIATLYPIYQLICFLILVLRLPFSMLYFLLWKVLAFTVPPIKNIERKKKEYKEAKNILSLICHQMGTSNPSYSYPLFEAVRQDTYEVVDEILFRSPSTFKYKDEEGHNIVQLAVINRSKKVYNLIHHIIEHTESYRTMIDSSENNLVHLAGRLAPANVLGRTTGAALQLQQELLWRAEVEKLMLPLELTKLNTFEETPAMVFTREHHDLMKEGENWMKTTAESCSITAALIVTVVFAAAITVPGGSNQESGIPVFEKEIAFTIFAVSNAFSLFTAATSLLLFLSILTARFSERDFLVSLPTRLVFGLLTLFLSTTAMMVAFGAILFLVFCDQRQWMLAPICAFACLPISVIIMVKFPLLVDLIQSTYFPIFGKQRYLESCKVNRKNTIFT